MENEKSLSLFEHLEELRSRLIRTIIYIILGSFLVWFFYQDFFKLLANPVTAAMNKIGAQFLITGVAEGFTLKLQISAIFGIILSFPFIILEIWGFISPALKQSEKKALLTVIPFSIILFLAGILSAYFTLPIGIEWLINQNPEGARFMPSMSETLLFIAKMELAFGVLFQMPIVIIFLAKIGLVKSELLIKFWREALIIICIIVAIITPTTDAFTMILMSAPMLLLYLITIKIVSVMEKRRNI
jgi:Twin arginine targeting (Tat) protein translocase TatC